MPSPRTVKTSNKNQTSRTTPYAPHHGSEQNLLFLSVLTWDKPLLSLHPSILIGAIQATMLMAQDGSHRLMKRTSIVLSKSFKPQRCPRGNASSLSVPSCYLKGRCFGRKGKIISTAFKAAAELTGSRLRSWRWGSAGMYCPFHHSTQTWLWSWHRNPHSTFTCLEAMKSLITVQFLICSTHSYWMSAARQLLGWGLRVIH